MRKWEPSPGDATNIAAFRWFANALENEALELYATDRGHFSHIERVLRDALKQMGEIRRRAFLPEEENGCPEGWVLCDGICKPSCDDVEMEASVAGASLAPVTGPTHGVPGGKTRKKPAPAARKR